MIHELQTFAVKSGAPAEVLTENQSAMVADSEWSRIHKEVAQYVEDARVELMLPVAGSALR